MGKEVTQIAIGVLVVIGLIAVVLGSARPTMVETGADPSGTPAGDGSLSPYSPEGGRVRGGNQSSGTSIFGFGFGGSTSLSIEFQVGDACYEGVSEGDEWPTSVAGCESGVPVEGDVIRKRRDEGYGGLLVVEMGVSKECWAVAAGGGWWPTGAAECASEEGG